MGKTFEELFLFLLKKKLICMALYRLRHATDNTYPYVYTNPLPDTIVSHRDRAFVLGIEVDDGLQGDKYEMIEKEEEVELGVPVRFDRNANKEKQEANSRGGAGNRGPGARKATSAIDTKKYGPADAQGAKNAADPNNLATTVGAESAAEPGSKEVFGIKASKTQSQAVTGLVSKLSEKMQAIERSVQ